MALLHFVVGGSSARADLPASHGYDSLLREAMAAHQAERWEEAAQRFAEANGLYPNARALRGLGVAEFEGAHFSAAIRDLEAALSHPERPLSATLQAAVRALIAEARARVGSFQVSVAPSDASVLVDGAEPVRNSQGHILIDEGDHELLATADGYTSHRMPLRVTSGEQVALRLVLALEPVASVAPAAAAEQPPTAPPAEAAPADTLRVAAALPRAAEGVKSERQPSRADRGTAPARMRIGVAIGSLGLSAAALVVAGGSYLGANARVRAIASECGALPAQGCSPEQADARLRADHVHRLERTTNAMLGVAAVAAVNAAVFWTLTVRSKRSPRAWLHGQWHF